MGTNSRSFHTNLPVKPQCRDCVGVAQTCYPYLGNGGNEGQVWSSLLSTERSTSVYAASTDTCMSLKYQFAYVK